MLVYHFRYNQKAEERDDYIVVLGWLNKRSDMYKRHTECFAAGRGARGDGGGAPRVRLKVSIVWGEIRIVVQDFGVGRIFGWGRRLEPDSDGS